MKTTNKVELAGYISNPEVMGMKNGTQLIKCSLATHEIFKISSGEWKTDTTWHRIIFWKSPKLDSSFQLVTGMFVKINGKLIVNQFTDKEGIKRVVVMVQALEIELVNEPESMDSLKLKEVLV